MFFNLKYYTLHDDGGLSLPSSAHGLVWISWPPCSQPPTVFSAQWLRSSHPRAATVPASGRCARAPGTHAQVGVRKAQTWSLTLPPFPGSQKLALHRKDLTLDFRRLVHDTPGVQSTRFWLTGLWALLHLICSDLS